ncbi:dihydroorotase [Leptolyngbya sp. FACHB-261]|nr:dihydroorotase [Leptolyngbya sp. FACHB-261]
MLRQVRLLDPVADTDQVVDVLIAQGKVAQIAASLGDGPEDARSQDCSGLILGPGLVDLYSQCGEPGFEERETLASLWAAARRGGYTRIGLLPGTRPPVDNAAALAFVQEHIPADGPCLLPWAAVTLGCRGEQLTELAELAEGKPLGFTDGQPLRDLALLRRLLEYAHPLGLPIMLWPLNRGLAGDGVMREGHWSLQFGLPGNPAMSESAALAALLEVVAATGTPVHLMRISTARGVELIRGAKARGLPVTASVPWFHLLLTDEQVRSYNPSLHTDPPLGQESDRAALLTGLRSGVLDAIAVDHTPLTYEEKTVPFAEAPPGMIGLELVLPLLWQALVEPGLWTPLELWRSLSTDPAWCLNQDPPMITEGQATEMILFDPAQTWLVEIANFKSFSHNTPWLGQSLKGQVLQMWCT